MFIWDKGAISIHCNRSELLYILSKVPQSKRSFLNYLWFTINHLSRLICIFLLNPFHFILLFVCLLDKIKEIVWEIFQLKILGVDYTFLLTKWCKPTKHCGSYHICKTRVAKAKLDYGSTSIVFPLKNWEYVLQWVVIFASLEAKYGIMRVFIKEIKILKASWL